MSNITEQEERWHSVEAFVAACTAAGKITEATGGMNATIDEINTFQELLKKQGFSVLPIKAALQNKVSDVSAEEVEESEKELEERTDRNMNVISDFREHVKSEAGFFIPESVILSFFNA